MIIGLLKENLKENRVSLLPEAVSALIKKKTEVWVEGDAGQRAFAYNSDYESVGAKIKTKDDIFNGADVLLRINPPENSELDLISENQVFLGVLNPLAEKTLVEDMLKKKITSFSLDSIPRTSRAQAMDILSSQATASGYRAEIGRASCRERVYC